MERDRTDRLRIRMAALQHRAERNARRRPAPSVLPTYTAAAADVGHTLRVKVIAKNIAGSGERRIRHRPRRSAGVLPSNVIAPSVLGLDITGQTLTASEGTWTGTEPITYCVPVAAVQQSRDRMRKHLRGDEIELSDPERRRDAHPARRRDSEKRRGRGRKGIGDDGRSARRRAEKHRSSRHLRRSQRRPAPDGFERQMERDRTDPLRIRMAALQHRRARMRAGGGALAPADLLRGRPRTSARRCG